MRTAIIVIIIAVVLIIPLQMILPFPFGIGTVFLLLILGIAGVIVSRRNFKKEEKFAAESLKYHYDEVKEELDEPKKDELPEPGFDLGGW